MFYQKRKQTKILVLSFFADSALWDNLIYLPGYPSGMSYFRPFRYREKWIEESLYAELQTKEKRNNLVGKEVLMAARFCSSDAHKALVLPIRVATIEAINYIPDNISIYFRLGKFFSPMAGAEACLKFEQGKGEPPEDKLFFRCSPKFLPPKYVSQEKDDEAWIGWVGKIVKDDSLPFASDARRSVFIKVRSLRAKRPVKVKKLYASWEMGAICGFCAKEGGRYELSYLHRVPFLFGTDEGVPKFKMKAGASTTNWEFSNVDEEVSGNYQLHVLSMSAVASSASWERISLIPDQSKVTTKKMVELNILPFTFNVKAKISFWHRFWRKYIWLIILGLSMLLKDIFIPFWKGEDIKPIVTAGAIGVIVAIVGLIIAQKNLVK